MFASTLLNWPGSSYFKEQLAKAAQIDRIAKEIERMVNEQYRHREEEVASCGTVVLSNRRSACP